MDAGVAKAAAGVVRPEGASDGGSSRRSARAHAGGFLADTGRVVEGESSSGDMVGDAMGREGW